MLISISRESLVLPLWRSLHSLNLMLAKDERKAMLLRLFNDDTPLTDRSKDRLAATATSSAQKDATSTSTSTAALRGTTAERAKIHYSTAEELADEIPEEEPMPIDEEEAENGANGEEVPETKTWGEQDEDGDGGEVLVEEEQESGELDIGGGEGIMRIGGGD